MEPRPSERRADGNSSAISTTSTVNFRTMFRQLRDAAEDRGTKRSLNGRNLRSKPNFGHASPSHLPVRPVGPVPHHSYAARAFLSRTIPSRSKAERRHGVPSTPPTPRERPPVRLCLKFLSGLGGVLSSPPVRTRRKPARTCSSATTAERHGRNLLPLSARGRLTARSLPNCAASKTPRCRRPLSTTAGEAVGGGTGARPAASARPPRPGPDPCPAGRPSTSRPV